jgi:hypothetical protein
MSKVRLTDDQIIDQMHAYIDLALSMSEFETIKELATAASLSTATIVRLMTHQTRFPRYLTLKKLGDATGLHLVWTKAGQPQLKLVS